VLTGGKFTGLTGVDAPYEVPEDPVLHLNTEEKSVEKSVERVMGFVIKRVR
jgi:adenylylsulfate kinase-like enzyme